MNRTDLLTRLRTFFRPVSRGPSRLRSREFSSTHRATFEWLEDRRLLATLTVNTWLDDVAAGDGFVSLREAILAANTNTTTDLGQSGSGADKIVFSFGEGGPQKIQLEFGELQITEALSISGLGQDLLTIDAQQNSRIFNITGTAGDVTIADMTLTRGRTTDNLEGGGAIRSVTSGLLTIDQSNFSGNRTEGDGAYGGGILAYGSVILTNCILSGNSTAGENAGGGGIYIVSAGSLTLMDSTVSGNSTTGDSARGGGLYVGANGQVTLTNSTVSSNSTAGVGSFGGGIHVRLGGVTLTNSIVDGNAAAGNGGGISLIEGIVTLTDSTVSGNETLGNGGGINASYAYVTLINSTISGNSAASGGGISAWLVGKLIAANSTISGNRSEGVGAHGGGLSIQGNSFPSVSVSISNSTVTDNESAYGGGIWIYDNNAIPISITNSIVAGNTDGGSSSDLYSGTGSLMLEYSLIGDTSGSGITAGTGIGNILNTNPSLDVLADYGGLTMTHALLPGGPAIDSGDSSAEADVGGVPEFDQRGYPFGRVMGGRIDIGAFEFQPILEQLPLLGDYNHNGVVDGSDYSVWRDSMGDEVNFYEGADGSGNGVVDEDDFFVWRANFGKSRLSGGAGGSTQVPSLDADAIKPILDTTAVATATSNESTLIAEGNTSKSGKAVFTLAPIPLPLTHSVQGNTSATVPAKRVFSESLSTLSQRNDLFLLAWLSLDRHNRFDGARRDSHSREDGQLRTNNHAAILVVVDQVFESDDFCVIGSNLRTQVHSRL